MKGGADVSESDEKIAEYFNQHLPKMAYDIARIISVDRLPANYSGRTLEWWKSEEGVEEAYKFLNRMFEHLMNK